MTSHTLLSRGLLEEIEPRDNIIDNNNIRVKCSDHIVIEVERALTTKMSPSIRTKLSSLDANSTITLENITSNALQNVLEYCRVHHNENTIVDLTTWDKEFVTNLEPASLCELASAAYHLEIKPLVDLTCHAIAQLLKGKSPSEIRRTFNILYDFNPEDGVPPPTMRDKLRNKFILKTQSKNTNRRNPPNGNSTENNNNSRARNVKSTSPPHSRTPSLSPQRNGHEEVDTRPLDDLLAFINETSSKTATNGHPSRKKKKTKKAQHKAAQNSKKENENSQKSEISKNNEIDSDCSRDDELDPELRAQQDREVEEFRLRLEAASTNLSSNQKKIVPPSSLTQAFVLNMNKR